MPYITENRFNLGDASAADRIFAKLRSYETLRTLDKAWFKTNGEIRSMLTQSELDARAHKMISDMYEERHNHALIDALRTRHRYMYVCLMKMALLQLGKKKRSVDEKVINFLAFCDEHLAAIFAREAVVARVYFERGQDLTFFGKIQRGQRKLLVELSNMAWDLLHIRQLEEGMTLSINSKARYFFTALLTFDQRLIEIIDLYPLRSIGFDIEASHVFPVYRDDWFEKILAEGEASQILERFYSEEARSSRNRRRDEAKTSLAQLADSLEQELTVLAG